MTRVASIDGALVPVEAATVSVYDRGFLYGDGVFETVRSYQGKTFALGEHITRLVRSAESLRIPMPIASDALAREVEAALTASGEGDAGIRVMITRGNAGAPMLVPNGETRATRVILVEPLVEAPRAIYETGLRVITLSWARSPDVGPPASAKLLPYVSAYLATQEARARGADDAIFVDAHGARSVREAATSNVFVVREDGVLATPPDGPGVLAGITRAHVIDLACTLGMSCAVCAVSLSDIAQAREVFLTSTLRELAPVVRVDDRVIAAGAPGSVTRVLHRALRIRAGARWHAPWEER